MVDFHLICLWNFRSASKALWQNPYRKCKEICILVWSSYLLLSPEKYVSLVKTFWNLFLHLLLHLANIPYTHPRWKILLAALRIKQWAKISWESYSHRIYILVWDVAFENGLSINKQPCLKMKVSSQAFWRQLQIPLLSESVCVCSLISTVETLFLTNAGLEVVWVVEW